MNISELLTHELTTACVNAFNINYTMEVKYNGRDGMDYVYCSINSLKKILVKDHSKDDIYVKLISKLERSNNFNLNLNFEIKYNDKYLYFNFKKHFMEKLVKENLVQNYSDNQLNKNVLKNILVDFSSPNIAKNMHVGHLRSTIIGDSICRLFEKKNEYNVLRINHIGDFGLPFGMLITLLIEKETDMENTNIDDLQKFYKEAKEKYDCDVEFSKLSHECLVKLQNEEPNVIRYWNYLKDISKRSYNDIYEKLNIKLIECGESFYKPYINNVIEILSNSGILEESSGMRIIKCECDPPLIVVKSNGGYTYDTTDLVAIWYRLTQLNMDEIYYVVDTGQTNHFKNIFEVAKRMGWLSSKKVYHIDFGVVQGENGKKFKSRSGDTIKLTEVLDESIIRLKDQILEIQKKYPSRIDSNMKDESTSNLAYGSIKYYDLSMNRTSNYKFSFDKMLNFEGNTLPYNMYAYVRIISIFEKENISYEQLIENIDSLTIDHPNERDLMVILLSYPEIKKQIENTLQFHFLTKYVYKLTSSFHKFFSSLQCLKYDGFTLKSINYSRLIMIYCVMKTLEDAFYILGITPLLKM